MIEKIKNTLVLNVAGQTFTTATNLKVYIKQYETELEYTPTVVSNTQVSVTIPYADAVKLEQGNCNVQLFFTDSNGNPRATKIDTVDVEAVIPEDGYNG